MYIIYCTTCVVNKKIYIGQHKTNNTDFDGYLGNGCNLYKPSTYEHPKFPFQHAVKKYGPKNFIRKTLYEVETQEEADAIEAELVNENFLKRDDVYNITLGGRGGDRGLNAKPCYQYDLKGNFIKEYPNRQDASRAVNRGFTTIKRAIKDKIKAADFLWSDEKVDKLDISQFKLTTNEITVFEYSKDGSYNCCYDSYIDAGRCNGLSDTYIRECVLCGHLVNNKYFTNEYESTYNFARKKQLESLPVYLYKVTGEFIKSFNNILELQKELKARNSLIKYAKLNKVFRNEYQISYEKLPCLKNRLKKKKIRKVNQYDLDGNFIKTWNSEAELRKIYGGGVRMCLIGRNKSSKGYKYKYADEEVDDIV